MKKISDLGTPLFEELKQWDRFSKAVAARLPEKLRQGFLGARLRSDGTLVFLVSSPIWSAQIRFSEAELQRGLDPRWGVRKIGWQVVPPEVAREVQPPPPTLPSEKAIAEMERLVSECGDGELRSGLERLLKTWRARRRRPRGAG